ncbi:MAG: trypsin-like peptidase domain-containing protein [Desulfamplus sp.]|nr:trypsin-like peptidase domain-containing protein [Desulfamplus sp.]
MKKNRNFQINNMIWVSAIIAILVIGAVWTNADFMLNRSVGGNQNLNPALLNQNTGASPMINNGALMNSPNAMNSTNNQMQSMTSLGNSGASTTTALMVQEGISHVVSMIKPSVVGVSRPRASQQSNATQAPAYNGGLSYIPSFKSGSRSEGSGVIIDPRGYILTTFQTVGTDTVVNVKLFSGKEQSYQADVVALDKATDLVVLKLRAQGVFPAVVLGNSNLVEVGDIVFAIGSPFGFSQTVTMGIVSSHNRNLSINGVRYPDMIQTDAAINQGNDGGPLVNIKGEVIGINMATFMPDNQYAGIGFAIPINDIVNFINSNI